MGDTGTDHEHREAIGEAARWILWGERDRSVPLVPQLKQRFGLSGKEACEAIVEANLIRARAI